MSQRKRRNHSTSASDISKSAILARIAAETYDVEIGGVTRTLNSVQLVIYKLRQLALNGNRQAASFFEELAPAQSQAHQGGYLIVPAGYTSLEESERALAFHHRHISRTENSSPASGLSETASDVEPAKAP